MSTLEAATGTTGTTGTTERERKRREPRERWERRRLRVALLGYGRVGQAVAALVAAEHERLRAAGFDVRIVGALVRDCTKPRAAPTIPLHTTSAALFSDPVDVVIDVMGGEHPAYELVSLALDSGAHVVSANKTMVAAHGHDLAELAASRGRTFLFDAAVLAGVPFLGALSRRPFIGAPLRITAIINGTSHFIADRMAAGGSLDAALADAIALGYAEPDASADLSGRDAAEKLAILLRTCGCAGVIATDLPRCGLGAIQPVDLLAARALGATVKPVALASLDPANPGAWVGPALIDAAHPFAALGGVTNAIRLENGIGDPVTFAGPGAGPRITAATILDDVIEAVAADRPSLRAAPAAALVRVPMRRPAAGPWYLRVSDTPLSASRLAELLASAAVDPWRVVECGRAIVARTGPAPWSAISAALVRVTSSTPNSTLVLPVVDTGSHPFTTLTS